MEYRTLGATGLKVSEIGFGTWQLGGISWNAPGDRECVSLLRQALDFGINLFDVSPSYGNGRSEQLIGEAFRGKRQDVLISAKVGVIEDGTYHGFWSERQLTESLEQSLWRLNTDYVDILTLHTPPMDVLKTDYAWEWLARLKDRGMVRFCGVSLEAQPEEATIALDKGIDILQIRYNLLFPEARRVFGLVDQRRAGLIINSTLGHGYLSGRYGSYDELPDGDYPKGLFRAAKPREMVDGMLRHAKAFKDLARRPLAETAIRFVMREQSVSSAVVGLRSAEDLEQTLSAAALNGLSQDEAARAAETYLAEMSAHTCP